MRLRQNWFPVVVLIAMAVGTAWALSFAALPPADFTFVNGTEVESLDPAIVTGQPEGRIINALFEGLTNWDPRDLHPTPGVAERWEISDDGRVYTFYLRESARWSDGTPVTADDFVYSWRRMLDPMTAARYAYQGWYIANGRKYTYGGTLLEPGDPVEIELADRPDGALPHARGRVLRGRLIEKIPLAGKDSAAQEAVDEHDVPPAPAMAYLVEIDGQQRLFQSTGELLEGAQRCEQVLLDFGQVGVKAIDDHTLRVTLENRTPYFLQLTGFYTLFPVNRRCLETHGAPNWTRPENLVSNGAFNLGFRRIRDRIRMVRSDTYWNRDAVQLNIVDALAVESDITAFNLYMTGAVDWIPNVPATVISTLIEQDRPDFQPAPAMTIYFYRLNTTRPPLDDPRVRRALALAINKEEICRRVTQAGEVPATSFVPPGLADYERAVGPEHNIAEARRLLAEAGFPNGQGFPRIDIMFNAVESHALIAQLIQSQWNDALGIRVATRQLEWGAYLNDQQHLKYWVGRAGWIGDYPDPNTFLDMFVTDGANNQTGWSNARYDELIQLSASEPDPQRRMAMLRKAEQILLDEMPIVPLYYYVSKDMVQPYVRGFYRNLQGVHPLDAISIDKAQREAFRSQARAL